MSARHLLCGAFLLFPAGCARRKVRRAAMSVSSIAASSHDSWFDPKLVLDGVPKSENAWHSRSSPKYPQWIEVRFPQEVELRKIGLQAQYGGGNLARAPRRVELWASNHRQSFF